MSLTSTHASQHLSSCNVERMAEIAGLDLKVLAENSGLASKVLILYYDSAIKV